MTIQFKIKEIREAKGMTLEELSKKSGVSSTQINDIENNIKDTTITNLCRIAEALQIDEKELYEKI